MIRGLKEPSIRLPKKVVNEMSSLSGYPQFLAAIGTLQLTIPARSLCMDAVYKKFARSEVVDQPQEPTNNPMDTRRRINHT